MRLPTLTAAALGLILAATTAHAQTSAESGTEPSEQEAEQAETTADEGTEQATEPATDYAIDTPLAEVDGTVITLGEMIAIRRELPRQYLQLPDEVLYDAIVEQLVNQLVLSRAAREAGVADEPAVALVLKNQQRAFLANAYLTGEVEKRATDEQIQTLYEERYVNAEPVPEVKAAHILVETEEAAAEIKAELDAGADFAELAAEHGTDGTAQRGGDLGWFTRDEVVPAFAEAAFAMEPGTVSDPVETDFGWHLIRLDEGRARPAPPLEEVRAELMQEVVRLVQTEIVEGLREQAEIEMAETPPPPGAVREDAILEGAE